MKSQINLLILFSSSATLPLRSRSTTVTALTWMGSSDNEQINEEQSMSPQKNQRRKKRKSRGSTTLPDVIKARSSGEKKVIDYNDKGHPIGKYSKKYASYLGVLARTMVPISHGDWFKVPSHIKVKLWSSVEQHSDDQRKRQSFNKYPCRLGRKGYAGLEEELGKKKPTQKLDRSLMWKMARQNKNGEYDNEKVQQQVAKIDEVTKQVDEGVLITHGSNDILTMALGKEKPGRVRGVGQFVTPSAYFHMPRHGNHSLCEEKQKSMEEKLCKVQAQLDDLRGHTSMGTHHIEKIGSNSLISDDIGSPQVDHMAMQNRVRSKDDLPPSNLNPKGKQCKLAVGSIENIVAHGTMYERVAGDETMHTLPLGEANVRVSIDFVIITYALLPIPIPGSITLVGEALGYQVAWPKNLVLVDDEGAPKHVPKQANKVRTKDDLPPSNLNPKVKKSKQCKLAVGSVENTVAHGTVYERVSSDETIHTLPLGDANVRVSVEFVIIPDALLPIPIPGDATLVGEAVGYEVAWPRNLVLVGDEGAPKHPPKQAIEKPSKHLGLRDDEATSKNVELESIELFSAYAKLLQYEETITIMLEEGIFGHKIQISLTREDMEYVCEMQELSLTCIMLYISYLYVAVKETNLDSRFLFVDPSIVSGKFKSGEFSKPPLLARRLRDAKAGQLVFVPYNIGFHWVLVVIDLSSAMVFYFDSISEKIDRTLQLVIDTALRTYDLNIGNRRSPAWNIIKCPKQPTSVECGFYVMRYMKDVIRDPSILSKRNFGGKKTYTTTEIDEARVEWINCVFSRSSQ